MTSSRKSLNKKIRTRKHVPSDIPVIEDVIKFVDLDQEKVSSLSHSAPTLRKHRSHKERRNVKKSVKRKKKYSAKVDVARPVMLRKKTVRNNVYIQSSHIGDEDSVDSIVYMTLPSGKDVVRLGTVNGLIRKLVAHVDSDFSKEFLFTYKSFATTETVVSSILDIIDGLDENEERYYAKLIRSINLIMSFVDCSYSELSNGIILRITDLKCLVEDHNRPLAMRIRDTMISHMLGETKKKKRKKPISPPPIYPKDWDNFGLKDLSHIEIARQLTMYDYELFKNIENSEFLNCNFSKSKERSPNLTALIRRFNHLVKYVQHSILHEYQLPSRVKIYSKWIKVAYILYSEIGNYNACFAIVSALLENSIYRLSQTKDRCKYNHLLDELESFTDPSGLYGNFRTVLAASNPPCIPYVGLFLTDIMHIEDSAENVIDEKYINFAKLRMIYETLAVFLSFQSKSFDFENVTFIQNWIEKSLKTSCDVSDITVSEMSLVVEPK